MHGQDGGNKVKACLPCQIVTPVYTREPLQMSVLPDNPFDEVSIDFAYVDGENLLLLIDGYSRFPFVEPVSSTSASAVIPKLDKLFATFGTPHVVKSDNGPPFNGDEFAKFAGALGFKHRKVTPLWPRANGEVERFVKTLKKYIKAAKAEGKNWRKELQAFLRNYRTTPHATTDITPATLLLKRAVRNKLPQINNVDPVAEIVRKHDSSQKLKIKAHENSKCCVKPCDVNLGESVLGKRPFTASKSANAYDPTPMTVMCKKGSMITVQGDGRTITRNSSFFKKLSKPVPNSDSGDVQDNDFNAPSDNPPPVSPDVSVIPSPNASNPVPCKTMNARSLDNPVHPEGMMPASFSRVKKQSQSVPVPPPLRRSTRKIIPRKIFDL